jgi:hypothetical protein
MSSPAPQRDWSKIGIAVALSVSTLLFVAAAYFISPAGPIRIAVTLITAAMLLAFLVQRLVGNNLGYIRGRPTLLLVAWSAAGLALVYGISQITPAGPARQFVWFFGLGVVTLLLGWWFSQDTFALARRRSAGETLQDRDTKWTQSAVLIWCYVGAVGLVLFAIRAVVPAGNVEAMFRILGAGVVIGGGAFLAGALLGFLFGIPRALPPTTVEKTATTGAVPPPAPFMPAPNDAQQRNNRPILQVNTNLEQISDWLTKIIVGLGLINLKQMPEQFRNLSSYLAAGFGNVEGREAITLALVILFLVSGFLLGYLLTRLFLTAAFIRADPTAAFNQLIDDVPSPPPPPAPPPGGAAGPPAPTPPPGNLGPLAATAQKASEVASGMDPSQIRSKVLELAEEYNFTRSALPYSPDRTRRLDTIVAKMKVVQKSAYWMLSELVNGDTPGERLAAIVFLILRPDAQYISWLVDRFSIEQPFLLYYAAHALRAAADTFGNTHRAILQKAIDDAIERSNKSDQDVQRFLKEAKDLVADK